MANNADSPLFKLPPELRNRICEFALVLDGEILVIDDERRLWKPPGLLQTCQQARREASGIYYGLNKFQIEYNDSDGHEATTWFRRLDSSSRLALGTIRLDDAWYFEGNEDTADTNLACYYREFAEAGVELDNEVLFVEFGLVGALDSNSFWANSGKQARERFAKVRKRAQTGE